MTPPNLIVNCLSVIASVSIPTDIWEFSIQGGLVLARPELQALFILNRSASALWSLLKEQIPPEAVVSAYSSLYSLPTETAAADIQTTLSAWQDELLSNKHFASSDPPRPIAPPPSFPFSTDYLINSTPFRVRIGDYELVEEIAPRLAALAAPPSIQPPRDCFDIFDDHGQIAILWNGELLGAEASASAARAVLLPEIVRVCYPGKEWLSVLHAGACGSDHECVLFAASTHSGKTTLAAALLYSDLNLFCDDSAALDATSFELSAMPFALMLRQGSWAPLRSRYPQIDAIPAVLRYGQKVKFLSPEAGQWPASSARVISLLFTKYVFGAPTVRTPLPPFEALVRLRESGFWVVHRQEPIKRFLNWIQTVPASTLTYSNLDEAIDEIRKFISS